MAIGNPAVSAAQTADAIEKLLIVGNKVAPAAAYLEAAKLRVGDPYDEIEARAAFRRIWELGGLRFLRLEKKAGKRGHVLEFIVTEEPRVDGVLFEPSSDLPLPPRTMPQAQYTLPRGLYDQKAALKIAHEIRSELLGLGFVHACVDIELRVPPDGRAMLVFRPSGEPWLHPDRSRTRNCRPRMDPQR